MQASQVITIRTEGAVATERTLVIIPVAGGQSAFWLDDLDAIHDVQHGCRVIITTRGEEVRAIDCTWKTTDVLDAILGLKEIEASEEVS